ncbi:MAG TPA: glycosyl transferase family 4 [Dokdonella sp.]|uniref:glycosyl transferase family 4 n=1 Tax=Dokdonella sp. TaxID=2291710 RepID=UPI002C3037D7|nr:glycosyl transferase family 4 [Dokdonella sp.]HUD42747.1 glycosyl transferase family 4 [Dokdonella sp.]
MTVSATIAAPLAALAFVLSALLTRASIAYALRRRLIDQPGQRRSHTVPTPRGGGIAIVAAVLVCIGVPIVLWMPAQWPVVAAIVLVAAVGWIDDHRPLGAAARLAVHALAAALVCAPAIPALLAGSGPAALPDAFGAEPAARLLLALAAVLTIVWSINLHNFMDGIDGLLALQALFVFVVMAVLLDRYGAPAPAAAALVMAAAVGGFVPFNFPRAHIFMGDVGSGVLGLLVALLGLAHLAQAAPAAVNVAIACSAFVVDASATLLSRMLRGRRWYSAHREHLYQWLVRSGRSHPRVVALYALWNLGIVVPVLCWVNRSPRVSGTMSNIAIGPFEAPPAAWGACAAVYAAGLALWFAGRRHCLRRIRMRGTR